MVAIVARKPIYKKRPEDFRIRRKLRFIFLRILRAIQLLVLLSMLSFAVWSIWFDKKDLTFQFLNEKSKQVLLDAGLGIKTLEFNGNEKVSNNEIIGAMLQNELEDINKYPIVMLSIDQVEKNLSGLKWIEEISITKKLPGTVIVNIKEKEPVALWQKDKEVWLSDKDGSLITKDIAEYIDLPLIVGKNKEADITEVIDIMAASKLLYDRVVSFTKIGGRRWNVKLKNGILVKLPEVFPIKAWRKLEEFENTKSILSKDINYIDLRIEGQLIAGLN